MTTANARLFYSTLRSFSHGCSVHVPRTQTHCRFGETIAHRQYINYLKGQILRYRKCILCNITPVLSSKKDTQTRASSVVFYEYFVAVFSLCPSYIIQYMSLKVCRRDLI